MSYETCPSCGHREPSDGYGGNDCPECGTRMKVEEVKMHRPSGKNENCLDGVICPQCGQEDKILVTATLVVAVTDNGVDFYDDAVPNHDVEYGPDSSCYCPACGHEATLGDFTPGPPGGEEGDDQP